MPSKDPTVEGTVGVLPLRPVLEGGESACAFAGAKRRAAADPTTMPSDGECERHNLGPALVIRKDHFGEQDTDCEAEDGTDYATHPHTTMR